jgi:HEAT repeat protein
MPFEPAPNLQAVPAATDPSQPDNNEQERLEALAGSAQTGDEQALRKALLDPDPIVQERALALLAEANREGAVAHLLDMTKSGQPETRIQALQLLHESELADEPAVVSSLGAALADEDLKPYAIEALAKRGGPEAMEYLQQALHDPDPKVRQMIIESAAPLDEYQVLLQQARWDEDETVRSLANAWLNQNASPKAGETPHTAQ